MRRRLGAALLALLAAAGGALADGHGGEDDAVGLTVLSFNVRSARGDDERVPHYDRAQLDALASMIEELRPDAVLLQEIDRGVARSQRVDQFESLREAMGMDGAFAGTVDYQGGRFGIAVLTRHEIVAKDHVQLPRYGGKEPRALLHLRIRVDDATEIDLFNTHIDPLLVSRDRQIELVLEHARRRMAGTAILGGDFNAPPNSEAMRRVAAVWSDAAAEAGSPEPTYPARDPTARVDYLFYQGGALALRSFATLDARGISDHRPLLARFEVRR